jgi:hypothetical protein
MTPNNKFDFNDINLIPKKCIVDSRSECDTSLTFGNFKFKMPIVPAFKAAARLSVSFAPAPFAAFM